MWSMDSLAKAARATTDLLVVVVVCGHLDGLMNSARALCSHASIPKRKGRIHCGI